MSISGDLPNFIDTKDFIYKLFNKALHNHISQTGKTNNINNPEQNPEEQFQTIETKCQQTDRVLRILTERKDTLKITKSYKLKKYCLKTIPILSSNFAITVNQINRLYKIYRKYLETWTNASEVCAELDRLVQWQEKRKQSVGKKCKKLICMYNPCKEDE